MFAPVYRQATIASLVAGAVTEEVRATAYGDVLGAWRDYLAHDNMGRGVVLIGHSQGTLMLKRLIHDEIDPDRAQRRLLVAAYLLGGNVAVKQKEDRGGDFRKVRLCGKRILIGCVVAFSSFVDPPPSDALFGRIGTGTDSLSGLPSEPNTEVACVDPASVGRNRRAPLHSLLPSEPFAPGLILIGTVSVYGGTAPTADTTWLSPQDHYTGRCERINGAHVLMLEPIDAARHLMASPDASWGTHLVDANIAMADVQRLIARQARAYLRRD